MSGLKKPKANAAAAPASKVTTDAPDDIDQIMNEIEELQQEMNASSGGAVTSPGAGAAPKLKVVPSSLSAETSDPTQEEEDALKEFHAGAGSEASLEETLSDLKDDPETHGNSILDQAIEQDLASEGEGSSAEDEGSPQESDSETHEQMETETQDFDETGMEQESAVVTRARPAARGSRARAERAEENDMSDSSSASSEGSLTMTLSGNMTLKLAYQCEGQEVTIGFADGNLCVRLSDGTEFKVPVARGGASSGAARKPRRAA